MSEFKGDITEIIIHISKESNTLTFSTVTPIYAGDTDLGRLRRNEYFNVTYNNVNYSDVFDLSGYFEDFIEEVHYRNSKSITYDLGELFEEIK